MRLQQHVHGDASTPLDEVPLVEEEVPVPVRVEQDARAERRDEDAERHVRLREPALCRHDAQASEGAPVTPRRWSSRRWQAAFLR